MSIWGQKRQSAGKRPGMDSNAPGLSEDAPNRGLAIDLTNDNPNKTRPKKQCTQMKGREGSKIQRRKKRKTKTWNRRKKRETKIWRRRRRRTYQQNLQRKRRRNLIDLRPGQSLFFLFLVLMEFSHFGSSTF
jgi:hypothetical protein